MTTKQYNRATEILREIKDHEGMIKVYEREINYNERNEKSYFRQAKKERKERIEQLKLEFEKL